MFSSQTLACPVVAAQCNPADSLQSAKQAASAVGVEINSTADAARQFATANSQPSS